MLKKLFGQLNETFSLQMMHKLIAILLIVLLLIHTWSVWGSALTLLWDIVKPFAFGFLLAYVCYPLIDFMKRKGVSSNLVIIGILVLLTGLAAVLILTVVPMLYSKLIDLLTSLAGSVEWIGDFIKEYANLQDFSLVDTISDQLVGFLKGYESWLPQVVSTIPSWMSYILDYLTNILFTLIIAIYMMADFERIRSWIVRIACWCFGNVKEYLVEIDESIHVYLKSMILVIVIRFVEYCLFYYLIGHSDWMVLGVLSALGAVIPYVGGIVANAVGILSGLMLPMERIIILLIGIVILSNVDNYVISPIVHKKRSALGPLTTLLAIFAGGMIGGVIGIMFSVPVVLAMKTIAEVYETKHPA